MEMRQFHPSSMENYMLDPDTYHLPPLFLPDAVPSSNRAGIFEDHYTFHTEKFRGPTLF